MARRQGRSRRERNWGIRDRLGGVDRVTWALGIAMFTVILVAVFPYLTFVPVLSERTQRGHTCSELANPIGGNNRSMLAERDDFHALSIDLELDEEAIRQGEPLTVRVIFRNRDKGPAVLYLPQDGTPVFGRDDGENALPNPVEGLRFELTRLDVPQGPYSPLGNPVLSAPTTVPPSFNWDDLHLLGPRNRCNEELEISWELLQALGVTEPGQYRIQVYYEVSTSGLMPSRSINEPTVTATAAFLDQGVLVADPSSNSIEFNVLPPATPTPTPSPTLDGSPTPTTPTPAQLPIG
ncbi:MAG: hypothetical protein GYB65_02185 [Chloroflexi bacterium]|nr:hypothetical protein [Chloroflexota bacterium]